VGARIKEKNPNPESKSNDEFTAADALRCCEIIRISLP
jgi:hypothetical protein